MASARAGEVSGPVAMMTLCPVGGGQARDLAALDGDEGVGFERRGHGGGEGVAVHGERAAGGHRCGVGRAHDERVARASPSAAGRRRCCSSIVGAEGVGADEFGEAVGLVRVGGDVRAAFRGAPRGRPACATCQAASEPAMPPPMMWMGSMLAMGSI